MRNQSILILGVFALTAVAILALGLTAWLLAGDPAAAAVNRDIQEAKNLAIAAEYTAIAGIPPTPIAIEPDSFRSAPTSLAEFRMLVPTLTPAATRETIFGDPSEILGPITWINSFDEGSLVIDDVANCGRAAFDHGRLVVSETGVGGRFCTVLVQPGSGDYYVEVLAAQRTACTDAEYGLYLRGTIEGEGALFGVTCDGNFSLAYSSEGFGGVFLDRLSENVLNSGPGPGNRLGVLARGDKLFIYANGAFLAEVSDEKFLEGGRFGLFVRTRPGNPVTVEFDDLKYWELSN